VTAELLVIICSVALFLGDKMSVLLTAVSSRRKYEGVKKRLDGMAMESRIKETIRLMACRCQVAVVDRIQMNLSQKNVHIPLCTFY